MTKSNLRYHYVEQRHLLNSCIWQHQWERPVPYANHSTAQLIEN